MTIPRPEKHHVGLARRPLDVAQRRTGTLDVGLRAGEPEQIAAVHDGRPREGNLLPAAHQLGQHNAAALEVRQLRQRVIRQAFVRQDHIHHGDREIEQLAIFNLLAEAACGHHHVAAGTNDDDVTWMQDGVGCRLHDRAVVTNPFHEDPLGRKRRFDIRNPPASLRQSPYSKDPKIPLPIRRLHARLGLLASANLLLELPAFGLEVHLEQPRREARQEPDDEAGADQVADRVGHGDVVQEPRLLGLRHVEPVDGVAGRANDGGFREGAGHQAGRRPAVVLEHLGGCDCHHQARHAEDDGQRHLCERVLPEAAEELRPHLVAGRKEEQVEENDLDDRVRP